MVESRVLPLYQEVWRSTAGGDIVTPVVPEAETPPLAVVGARPCELAALAVLDRVLLEGVFRTPATRTAASARSSSPPSAALPPAPASVRPWAPDRGRVRFRSGPDRGRRRERSPVRGPRGHRPGCGRAGPGAGAPPRPAISPPAIGSSLRPARPSAAGSRLRA